MEDFATLRAIAEEMRSALTAHMDEPRAWEWMLRLTVARALVARGESQVKNPGDAVRRAERLLPGLGEVPARAAEFDDVQHAWSLLCEDAHRDRVDRALADPTGIGWVHQYWVNADKARVAEKLRRKTGDTIAGEDLVAATCVYTRKEHVRFLLQNTLGRQWLRRHPGSSLREQWHLLVDDNGGGGGGGGGARAGTIRGRGLTVLDPACGAGHFLVEALDMLFAMERELHPRRTPTRICRDLLGSRVFGLDLDERAVRIARLTLSLKCLDLGSGLVPMRVEVAGATALGSLERRVNGAASESDRILARRYDVVAMNPPFVGFRKLSPDIKARLAQVDPDAASDLAVAFISRGFRWLREGGLLGVVSPAAWLNSGPARPLRDRIVREGGPRLVASLGQRVFETAPLLFASLAVLERGEAAGDTRVIEQVGRGGLEDAITRARTVSLSRVRADPDRSFAPATVVLPVHASAGLARVGDFFTLTDGVWTGDNARDTREWGDVEAGDRDWVPASGGHGHCRWYGPVVRVMRAWAAAKWPRLSDRPGCLEYSRVAGGKLAARAVFERSAPMAGVVSMMPRPGAEDRRADVLAVFNSRVGTLWLRSLVSGLNFNQGYAARVPLPPAGAVDGELVTAAVDLARELARGNKRSADYAGPIAADVRAELEARLAGVEAQIDRAVAEAMGVTEELLEGIRLPAPGRRRRTRARA